MAGGYLTDTGFIEDTTQKTETVISEDSVCGQALKSLEEPIIDSSVIIEEE